MATEKFTPQEFEDSLERWRGEHHPEFAWESGQYVARLYFGNNGLQYIVKIYSTIFDGAARDTGEDSIRIVLLKNLQYGEKPAMSKEIVKDIFGQHYVTRVPGWQERINKRIAGYESIINLVGECNQCGPKSI